MEFIKTYLEACSIKLLKISFGVEEIKARQKESFFSLLHRKGKGGWCRWRSLGIRNWNGRKSDSRVFVPPAPVLGG